MSDQHPLSFDHRFQQVVASARATGVYTVLGWGACALAVGLSVLLVCDYFWELSWPWRAAMLTAVTAGVLCASAFRLWHLLRHCNRLSTAVRVERRFQDLGQSVRTLVQYQCPGHETGASPHLLQALRNDIDARTAELRLSEAVSQWPWRVARVVFCAIALLYLGTAWSSWAWRVALQRALLGNEPYTSLDIEPGTVRLDAEETFQLATTVRGRIPRSIVLCTRSLNESNSVWDSRLLDPAEPVADAEHLVRYEAAIPHVTKSFEYYVRAGKNSSPVHRVDVRHPLSIKGFHVEVTPPAYTGLSPKVIDRGNFEAVEGSVAKLRCELDQVPTAAWLELRPLIAPAGTAPISEMFPLTVEGSCVTTTLTLEEDKTYQVFAHNAEGARLKPHRFRIRVHEDRPPRLTFQQPADMLEVHSLAEILTRLLIVDDFGLRNAKLVFQVNNDPEIVLESVDFVDADSPTEDSRPQTRAVVDARIPLEYLQLTMKDSISYYATAVDNRPNQPNVNDTELRFLDIRPFRLQFPAIPSGDGIANVGRAANGRRLPILEELIERQRFVLNRLRQIHRRAERGKSSEASAVDGIIQTQNEVSQLAGLLGDEAARQEVALGIPDEGRISDLFYKSQEMMLSSVDAMAQDEWQMAKLQVQDALRLLLDCRSRLDRDAGSGAGRFVGFRAASRRLMLGNRQPRNEAERVRTVVLGLKKAAADQSHVIERLSHAGPSWSNTADAPDAKDISPSNVNDENSTADGNGTIRRQIADQQLQLIDDVDDLMELIDAIGPLGPLVQRRRQELPAAVRDVATQLERDQPTLAIPAALQSTVSLRLLAEHIDGSAAPEPVLRIEIAQSLGMAMMNEIRELAGQLESTAASEESSSAAQLSQKAAEQAEVALTVQDILASITDAERAPLEPNGEAVKRLTDIVRDTQVSDLIGRLQDLPEMIDAHPNAEAGLHAADLAERIDVLVLRLSTLQRELLEPRVEQIRLLANRARQSQRQLESIDTSDTIGRWHLQMEGLLRDIETAGIATDKVTAMRDAMRSAGWNDDASTEWNWRTNDMGTGLLPPDPYALAVAALVSEIQRHVDELTLHNRKIGSSRFVPQQYRAFVDRYFEALAGAGSGSAAESNND